MSPTIIYFYNDTSYVNRLFLKDSKYMYIYEQSYLSNQIDPISPYNPDFGSRRTIINLDYGLNFILVDL